MKAKRMLFTVMAIIGCAVMCSAQSKDEVTLVVSGDGVNKEEATKVALRSAIEQAYGTFVSANTSIVNDELIKDEIVTVASGNIKSYEEISSEYLSNGKSAVTLKATVSISKLISYAQSKGASTEFAGATFAMNMKMYELNKKNEIVAIKHLLEKVVPLVPYSLKRELVVGEPVVYDQDYYKVDFAVVFKPTEVMTQINEMILKTMEALSLSEEERENLWKRNIDSYSFNFRLAYLDYYSVKTQRCRYGGMRKLAFRNEYNSGSLLFPLQELFEREVGNWEIVDNTGQISSFECMELDLADYEKNGRDIVDFDIAQKNAYERRKKYLLLHNPTGLLSVGPRPDYKRCIYLRAFGYEPGSPSDNFLLIDTDNTNADSTYVADVFSWHILIPKDEISKYSSFEVRRKGAPLPALYKVRWWREQKPRNINKKPRDIHKELRNIRKELRNIHKKQNR